MPTDPIVTASGIGAAFTPEEWASYVLDHLSAASVVLASGATEIRTSAKQVHVPRVTRDGAVGWYDELEEIAPGAPDSDELVLTPKKVAALARLSNESINDSDPKVLDVIGTAIVRALALEADRALIDGTGTTASKQPKGVLRITGIPPVNNAPDYGGIVRGAGAVRAAGGRPNVVYLNPADLTALQLATDATTGR